MLRSGSCLVGSPTSMDTGTALYPWLACLAWFLKRRTCAHPFINNKPHVWKMDQTLKSLLCHHHVVNRRFRGHCIVEFGEPLVVSPGSELVQRYNNKEQRRQVCSDLLEQVEKGLRGVTLNVPTYEDRQVTLTVRSLYQPASLQLASYQYQRLNRCSSFLSSKERGEKQRTKQQQNFSFQCTLLLGHHRPGGSPICFSCMAETTKRCARWLSECASTMPSCISTASRTTRWRMALERSASACSCS